VSYRLTKLAAGSYDVWLNGVIVASLVRSGQTHDAIWTAELLSEPLPGEMPAPFTAPEHTFGSLEEARIWLGAPIAGSGMRATEET
jgi:hypothetical protein